MEENRSPRFLHVSRVVQHLALVALFLYTRDWFVFALSVALGASAYWEGLTTEPPPERRAGTWEP